MISDLTLLEGAARAVAQALLNGLWQGVLLTAAVAVILQLLRGTNAATRYAVWYATLLFVVALPLAAAFSQRASAPSYAEPRASSATPAEPRVITRSEAEIRGGEHAAPAGSPRWRIEVAPGAWLVLLLGGGLLIGAARVGRLVLGLRVLRRLKRTSRALPSSYHAGLEPVCAAHVRRRLSLRMSDRITTPITVGFLHPAVLLPAGLLEKLSGEELRQIILHELAHLRRRDDWTNLAQRLVEAVLFFHPAVWWIGRRLDLEREIACDDYVVAALAGERAGERAYARCLTRLAELAVVSRASSLTPGAAPRSSHLARRVRALLSPSRPSSVRISLASAAVLVVLLAAGGAALIRAAPALALVAVTPGGAGNADRPSVEGIPITAADPADSSRPAPGAETQTSSPSDDGLSAPVRTTQTRVARGEISAATALAQPSQPSPTPAGELAWEAEITAGLADSPAAAAADLAATLDELPPESSLAHFEPVEPTVAQRNPVSPPRSERRGVNLEITLALPRSAAVAGSGRTLPTPSSLGLPTIDSQGRNGWAGGIGAQAGGRGFSGGGGIRLRVTGGSAPGNPYAAPWGRW